MGRTACLVRPVGRHRVKRICQIHDLGDVRYLAVIEPVGVTASVEALVVVLCRQRNVSVRVMDRLQYLKANGRMLVKLGRLFGVDAVRSVYDLAFDRQFADVVKVAGGRRTLDLIW